MRAAEFFQRCIDAGVPTDMAIIAMKAFEAEVEIVIDLTLDKRRSADRDRQARKRERDHVMSRDVTLPNVSHGTARDQRDGQDAPAPLHVRGENNLSRLVDTGTAAAVAAEAREPGSDWPAGKAADHVGLLVTAASTARLDPARMPDLITTAGRIDAWKRGGASWEHDVLPVVTALARKTGPPIRNWKFFDGAIGQSVADNCQALILPPAKDRRHDRPDQPSAKLAGKLSNLERSQRGAQAVLARERL